MDKELGKIRKKFASGNTVTGEAGLLLKLAALCTLALCDKALAGAEYDKKKYVWKLLYIYMLGYEVEFGHKQAADLIPATKCACSLCSALGRFERLPVC